MESRLDRIEKGIEKLFEGIAALQESQTKTDEQLSRTDEQLSRTDEQLSRTDGQLSRTDGQLSRTDEQLSKTIKKLDDIGRQLGDLGLVQGEVAEDLFFRNVRYLFKEERDLIFSDVKRNLKKKGSGEYDIVAVNGDAVLVIEVKNKLQNRMVDNFVEKKLPKFKKTFPEYRGRRLFGGIGALVVKDAVGRYAEKAGLYVLTQTTEGGAGLINRKNFRAKEFS
jgi:Holliday junction resolvase-like predicted endonuclease